MKSIILFLLSLLFIVSAQAAWPSFNRFEPLVDSAQSDLNVYTFVGLWGQQALFDLGGQLIIYDHKTKQVSRKIQYPQPENKIYSVETVNPKAGMLFRLTKSRPTIELIHLESGNVISRQVAISQDLMGPQDLRIMNSGKRIFLSNPDFIYIFDENLKVKFKRQYSYLKLPDREHIESADGRFFAVVGCEGEHYDFCSKVFLYDLTNDEEIPVDTGSVPLDAAEFSSDSKYLYLASEKDLLVYDLQTGNLKRKKDFFPFVPTKFFTAQNHLVAARFMSYNRSFFHSDLALYHTPDLHQTPLNLQATTDHALDQGLFDQERGVLYLVGQVANGKGHALSILDFAGRLQQQIYAEHLWIYGFFMGEDALVLRTNYEPRFKVLF